MTVAVVMEVAAVTAVLPTVAADQMEEEAMVVAVPTETAVVVAVVEVTTVPTMADLTAAEIAMTVRRPKIVGDALTLILHPPVTISRRLYHRLHHQVSRAFI